MTRILIDTGPLVALLNRRDRHHAWVREVLDAVEPPVYTCEAVVSEACFLLGRVPDGADAMLELLHQGIVRVDYQLAGDIEPVQALMRRFADVPMSLADACLVRMSEADASGVVLTLDGDFRVYRKGRRHVIPAILPDSAVRRRSPRR